MNNYTQPQSATTCYHGRPLWFNFGGHFYFMRITSQRIIILHNGIGFLIHEHIFEYQICFFLRIGWKVISPYTLRKHFRGHFGL